MKQRVEFQAFLGPEVNGVTLASQAVLELASEDAVARHINTASHFARLSSEVANLLCLRRGCTVYRTLSGGKGVLFDLFVVAAAMSIGVGRFVFHHHSYAYLTTESRLHRALFRVTKKRSTHVVLAPEMGILLSEHYALGVANVVVADNLGLIDLRESFERSSTARTISVGMLSNLTIEKGGEDFLALAGDLLKCFGDSIHIDLAGPVADELVGPVGRFAREFPRSFRQWGCVRGEQKSRFLSHIDIFVFPTRYQNEAQPLVLYEALLAGCDVVAYRRGAIGSQLEVFPEAKAVASYDEMVAAVEALIRSQLARGSSECARRRAEMQMAATSLRATRRDELARLFKELFSPSEPR